MRYKLSKKAWEDIGKKVGWMKESSMSKNDIHENIRFYDTERHQEGKLVTRTYHRTTLWMMLYDSGEIVELHAGDLEKLKQI